MGIDEDEEIGRAVGPVFAVEATAVSLIAALTRARRIGRCWVLISAGIVALVDLAGDRVFLGVPMLKETGQDQVPRANSFSTLPLKSCRAIFRP